MKHKLHVKQKIEWEMLRENLDERNQNTTLRQFGWICQTLNMKRHRLYIKMPDTGLMNHSQSSVK